MSQALSHWRPSIDATGTYGKTWQFAPGLNPFGPNDFDDKTRGYGVQVTQPLFRGFRTKAETEAAEKQVLAGRAKLGSAEQQLFLDTASAYLGVLRDEAVLGLERNHEAVLEDKLKETKVRSEVGELTGTDVRQAESRLARAHVSRFQAESTLTQDRASFARLVGNAPGQLQTPVLALDSPRTLADIFHLAETQNPDVVAAQFAAEEADAEIRLNKGSLLPEVNLVGNSGRNWGQNITVPGREDSSQVLVQLTIARQLLFPAALHLRLDGEGLQRLDTGDALDQERLILRPAIELLIKAVTKHRRHQSRNRYGYETQPESTVRWLRNALISLSRKTCSQQWTN